MSSSLRYQFTYCNLLYTLTNNYLFLLTLTLIFPQSCYVCLVFLFNTLHTYIYICIDIYIYTYNWTEIETYTFIHIQIHYANAYEYTQYVLSETGDCQHLLRAKLKLAKHPTRTTHYVFLLTFNYPQSW